MIECNNCKIREDVIKNMCENEEEARKIARKTLSDFEVYGDTYGVPTIQDVVQAILDKYEVKVK